MAKLRLITQETFYGGQVRDDKSNTVGANLNVEELDILENADVIKPAKIFSSDSLPSNTELYAYDAADDDTLYGYAEDTANSDLRIVELSNSGNDNPGSWSTKKDDSQSINVLSPLKWFSTSENTAGYLYYITGTNDLRRLDLENNTSSSVGTLSGLSGSFDRPTMKVIFGELFICHGNFIAKVDSDGVFTQKAFTMPSEWDAVDIIPVSDIALILARNVVRNTNHCKGFWWDLTRTQQFDDSFNIPMGGPQWIVNFKENLIIFCAINGEGRFFQMSAPSPGAKPLALPGIRFESVASESSNQPISPPKSVSTQGDILYFGLNKTDKTGLYALGQLDSNKTMATYLAKRFSTSDYSNHSPTALHIQGPNFYGAFDDNGTQKVARLEANNSPNRSSNAVLESVFIDDGSNFNDKNIEAILVGTKPLPASTDIDVFVKPDYGSYSEITREDGSSFDTTNGVMGYMAKPGNDLAGVKSFQVKLEFTSNGTDTPELVAVGHLFKKEERIAKN